MACHVEKRKKGKTGDRNKVAGWDKEHNDTPQTTRVEQNSCAKMIGLFLVTNPFARTRFLFIRKTNQGHPFLLFLFFHFLQRISTMSTDLPFKIYTFDPKDASKKIDGAAIIVRSSKTLLKDRIMVTCC